MLKYEDVLKSFDDKYNATHYDTINEIYDHFDKLYTIINSKDISYEVKDELHYFKLRYTIEKFQHHREYGHKIRAAYNYVKIVYLIKKFVNKRSV